MTKIVKMFFIIWVFLAVIGLVLYVSKPDNRFILFGLGFIAVAIFIATVKERWRRKNEGYYVFKRGGAENGVVIYDEGGQTLQLYFDRRRDTIYVPSDATWTEIMPSWAKERKHEVVTRIKRRVGKRLIGKSWTYEETDKPEFVALNR
jgi:hypothetical protein